MVDETELISKELTGLSIVITFQCERESTPTESECTITVSETDTKILIEVVPVTDRNLQHKN